MMGRMKQIAKDNGWTGTALEIVLSADAMIMRNGLLLSNRKDEKNRLIGCQMMESETAILSSNLMRLYES
jgi:hypothetical protein